MSANYPNSQLPLLVAVTNYKFFSVIYQEILQEGQQREGATLVLRLLARRLGQVSPEVRSRSVGFAQSQLQQLPVA
ncbi:MAG: DUF4351 domain-containing protein [Chroococcidiopsidaceae cyanobacterium CP_BM_RX_35]|nr:DUF4351 domain-containing protein [Chroococcidiopsidaceae cyanobacterium CP_BM_RX_35]